MEMQAPAPIARYRPGAGAGTTGIHTVLQGDTLWLISKRYNIASRDIAVTNNLQAPFYLSPGTRLKMPPPQQYTARAGDNLNTVSRLFAVGRSEIAKMNHLNPPYTLKPGQVLRLPSVTEKNEPEAFAQTVSAAPVTPVHQEVITMEELSAPRTAMSPPPSASPTSQVHILQLPPGYGEKPAAVEAAPVMEERSIQMVSAKPVPKSPVTAKMPPRSSKKFLRPVKGSVLSAYGPKPGGLFNDGVNISAPRDVPVKAAENGVVVYVGDELKGSGNLVLIRHADRWMTAYAHLGNIQIQRGAVVKRGQVIGTVGSSGSVDKPQLHFEVRRGTEAINPEVYMEG